MFTDVYFTNLTPAKGSNSKIAFFQKNVAATASRGNIFQAIRECQYGWSHVVRIPWDLSFCLVKSSGNRSPVYHLKTMYGLGNKKFLIGKEGIVTLKQNYGNGKQLIDFEQIRGTGFASVQCFRGKFLIAELPFIEKRTQFQIDTKITIIEGDGSNWDRTGVIENPSSVAYDFDLTGTKAIHITINKKILNKLIVQNLELW